MFWWIQDKKSVDSVCTCFARLVDNLHHDEKLLKELAAHEMLANILKLVSTTVCLEAMYFNPYSAATNSIGQKYNGPEYWY